jgi:hypothetical protein
MSTSFTRTTAQLADMVLRKLGVLGSGLSVSSAASDVTIVTEAIDVWIKQAHREGIYWRKVTKRPLSFTIPANTASASAASVGDMLFPISMHVMVNSVDEPVDIIGPMEYADISEKSFQGPPTKALWTGSASAEFIFWPIPTVATTAKLIYEAIPDDTTANAAIDVDVSNLRWVKDIIAYNLADEYEVPEAKIQRWAKEAEFAMVKLRKLNALRVDPKIVPVDNFDARVPDARGIIDYRTS